LSLNSALKRRRLALAATWGSGGAGAPPIVENSPLRDAELRSASLRSVSSTIGEPTVDEVIGFGITATVSLSSALYTICGGYPCLTHLGTEGGAALEEPILATQELIGDEGRDEIERSHAVGLGLEQACFEDVGHAGQTQLAQGTIEFDEVHVGSPVLRSMRSR
jgi:hypothetical protein